MVTTSEPSPLELLVARAISGDRAALDRLLFRIEDDVYGLALRMLGDAHDAEDATQEILLVVVTHLATFEGRSSFRTWVWRVASHHLLKVRRGRKETVTFAQIEELLAQGEGTEPVALPEAERALLTREVEIGCTQGMLLALDRPHRLAFILCEILELSTADAAAALDVEPAALRKRVSRARKRIGGFVLRHCGIADPRNACRCERQVTIATRAGLLDPGRLVFATHATRDRARELDELQDELAVFRAHPDYAVPSTLRQKLRELIASKRFGVLDA